MYRGAQLLDELADRSVERVGIDDLHGAAVRGLTRASPAGAECLGHR
jgi:hypothetical protein